jgi:hypothetical protein
MAITQALCSSFKSELLSGVHDFAVGGDVFKVALYNSAASLNSATTAYTTSEEITGTGYLAGGKVLTNSGISLSGTTAYLSFSDLAWTAATFGAAGALLYNSSKSNKAVAVFNFGQTYAVSSGVFNLVFPQSSPTTAVITLT